MDTARMFQNVVTGEKLRLRVKRGTGIRVLTALHTDKIFGKLVVPRPCVMYVSALMVTCMHVTTVISILICD
jgi:hypothetical protein